MTKDPKYIINLEVKKIESDFNIEQVIDLRPYDKDHAMVIAKSLS
uniref:Fibrillarin-like rRNA methylase n=1 Tax=uncultured marine thaumarchaeote KM3_03_D08 TaxID=1455960 RepID=A0A075G840_9ARCH|nr:Fibrillarin-like rRNA methylase [uncultured marine thaumarchaeote KM3_03_D08]